MENKEAYTVSTSMCIYKYTSILAGKTESLVHRLKQAMMYKITAD